MTVTDTCSPNDLHNNFKYELCGKRKGEPLAKSEQPDLKRQRIERVTKRPREPEEVLLSPAKKQKIAHISTLKRQREPEEVASSCDAAPPAKKLRITETPSLKRKRAPDETAPQEAAPQIKKQKVIHETSLNIEEELTAEPTTERVDYSQNSEDAKRIELLRILIQKLSCTHEAKDPSHFPRYTDAF